MKYECDMIEDLLPLYQDGACSGATRQAVEEHLAECSKCSEMLRQLKETVIDEMMVREKEDVIDSQSKFFKRKSALAGSIIAAIFAIPILICLIVDLASGHGLGWFFIVLASMLVASSLIIVPLMVPENRMFLTMVSFACSLMLLLAVVCIYTHGRWFFVAGSSVLFGLTVCFSPFIACHRPVKEHLRNFKGLAVMAAYTVTFFLMLLCIGLYAQTPGYFPIAFGISIPLVVLVWLIFLIIRYLPANGLVKTGVCIILIDIVAFVATRIGLYLSMHSKEPASVLIYSYPSVLNMICVAVIGVIFAAIGLLIGRKKREEKINEQN